MILHPCGKPWLNRPTDHPLIKTWMTLRHLLGQVRKGARRQIYGKEHYTDLRKG